MLGRLALLVGCAVAFNAAAQGLFDDNEARRRVELLRQEFTENQRQVAEQLKKIEAALAGASDRSALIQLATQVETLNNELARMRGQLEVLGNQAENADRRQKDLYLSIASSQETMGDRKSAQKTLEDVIAKYPKSSAAASAKQRLNAVKRQAP